MSDRTATVAVGAVSIATALGVWELASDHRLINPVLMPPPSKIAISLWTIIANGSILEPFVHTVGIFAAGFAIALLLGVAAGIAMGTSATIYGLLEPLVEVLRPIPKSALVPALFLFLGIGTTTMLTVVVFACFFPIVIATLQAVRTLDPVLLETAATFKISRMRVVRHVILPASVPMIMSGARVSLGLGLVMVVLAEMLAGDTGLGFNILDLQRSFRSQEMFAWVTVLVVLGCSLTFAMERLERRLVPWQGRKV